MGAVSLMRIRLQQRTARWRLSSQKLAPLGEGGGTHRFEHSSVVDVAVWIEVIVERSVGRNEFLEIAHPSKSRHRSFSSSEGRVTILPSVI